MDKRNFDVIEKLIPLVQETEVLTDKFKALADESVLVLKDNTKVTSDEDRDFFEDLYELYLAMSSLTRRTNSLVRRGKRDIC